MNNEQLMSLLRTILQMIGTAVVAHGTLGINGAMWEQISGAVLMLAPTIWSMYAHKQSAQIANVAAMTDVAKVTVKDSATDGIASMAADPDQPKVSTVSGAVPKAA